MNSKQKREWIIKYIKKNNFDDLLSQDPQNKNKNSIISYINQNSNLIQAICSIISVGIISVALIIIAIQANLIYEKQTVIMQSQQQPVIEATMSGEKELEKKVIIDIENNGAACLDTEINIISYFDVLCNENVMGRFPTRIYLASKELNNCEYYGKQDGKIATLTSYTDNSSSIALIEDEFYSTVEQYTNLFWQLNYTTLIRVSNRDVFGNNIYTYYLMRRNGLVRLNDSDGDSIYEENTAMIDNGDGSSTSKERYYKLDKLSGNDILKYALSKIRAEGLYTDGVTYGEYEPKE
nr:hypothetical protein [uncultured Aminipila sp.]